jgi:hypothetical protein
MRARTALQGASALVAAALASLTPALAAACPYCASQGNSGNGQTIALGAFILLPFLVTGVILKVVRSEASMASGASFEASSSKAPVHVMNKTSNQGGSRRIAE